MNSKEHKAVCSLEVSTLQSITVSLAFDDYGIIDSYQAIDAIITIVVAAASSFNC